MPRKKVIEEEIVVAESPIEIVENKPRRGRPKKSEAMMTDENIPLVSEVAKSNHSIHDKGERKVTPNEEIVNDFPDVRYDDEDLDTFHKIIIEAKAEAMDELKMLKERIEDLQSIDFVEESMIYSMHMAEQGSEAQEKEKTYAQIQRINEYIKKLEEALGRIKDKSYGVCRVCGCLIAKERLLAVPITTLSASYKIHQRCPDDGIDKIEPLKK